MLNSNGFVFWTSSIPVSNSIKFPRTMCMLGLTKLKLHLFLSSTATLLFLQRFRYAFDCWLLLCYIWLLSLVVCVCVYIYMVKVSLFIIVFSPRVGIHMFQQQCPTWFKNLKQVWFLLLGLESFRSTIYTYKCSIRSISPIYFNVSGNWAYWNLEPKTFGDGHYWVQIFSFLDVYKTKKIN